VQPQRTVQENTLTISGQQKEEEGDKEGQRYHVRERRIVSFTRSYSFPTPVDADKAEARFENGELRLRLPKAEGARPRQIRIGGQSGASQPTTPQGASPTGSRCSWDGGRRRSLSCSARASAWARCSCTRAWNRGTASGWSFPTCRSSRQRTSGSFAWGLSSCR